MDYAVRANIVEVGMNHVIGYLEWRSPPMLMSGMLIVTVMKIL
jgi:hypothetical protein